MSVFFLVSVDSFASEALIATADTIDSRAVKEVRRLLKNPSEKVDDRDAITGRTALMKAAYRGNLKVVKVLVEEGRADVNLTDTLFEDNALTLAVQMKQDSVVEYLISRQANVDHANKVIGTPLMIAAHGGYSDILRALLEASAQVDLQAGSLEQNALMEAAQNNNVSEVVSLLNAGANRELTDKEGKNAEALARAICPKLANFIRDFHSN